MMKASPKEIMRLFPASWRARYGDEVLALLEAEGLSIAIIADLLKTAAVEWAVSLMAERKLRMLAGPKSIQTPKPPLSGYIPVFMSLAALAVVTLSLTINGVKPQHDEDALAHIYQILIVAEFPVIGFFVLRWIRTRFWLCVRILIIQAIVLATALLPVWFLHL